MADDPDLGGSGTEGCNFARLHLHAYIETELDPIRTNMVRLHLEGCDECREIAEDFKLERLWLVETMVKSPALSQGFLPRVMQQVEAEARLASWAARKRAWLPWLGAAAALLLVALVAGRFIGDAGRSSGPVTRMSPGPVDGGFSGERAADVMPTLPIAHSLLPPPPIRSAITLRHHGDAAGSFGEPGSPPGGLLVGSRAGVRSFGQVISFATSLAPLERRASGRLEDDPCKPDLNSDGRTDWSDVAYSCQVLVRGAPPETLQREEPAAEATDCDEHCYRA